MQHFFEAVEGVEAFLLGWSAQLLQALSLSIGLVLNGLVLAGGFILLPGLAAGLATNIGRKVVAAILLIQKY